MNSYSYKVLNLARDVNDIVVSATFDITADDGVDSFTHTCIAHFTEVPEAPKPFESLKESDVVGWITSDTDGKKGFEAGVAKELAAYKERKAAPVLVAGVPWAK